MHFKRKRIMALLLSSLVIGTGTVAYAGSMMLPDKETHDMFVSEDGTFLPYKFYEVYNPNQTVFYYANTRYEKKDIVIKKENITPGYEMKDLKEGQTVDAKLKEISVSINKKKPIKMKAYTVGNRTFVRPAEFYKAMGANAYFSQPNAMTKDEEYVNHPCLGYGGVRISVKPYSEFDLLEVKKDLKSEVKATLDRYNLIQCVGGVTTLGFVEDRDIFFDITQLAKAPNDLNVQVYANRSDFGGERTLLNLKMKDLGKDGIYYVTTETTTVTPIGK